MDQMSKPTRKIICSMVHAVLPSSSVLAGTNRSDRTRSNGDSGVSSSGAAARHPGSPGPPKPSDVVPRHPVRNRDQRSHCIRGKALMGIAGSIVIDKRG